MFKFNLDKFIVKERAVKKFQYFGSIEFYMVFIYKKRVGGKRIASFIAFRHLMAGRFMA